MNALDNKDFCTTCNQYVPEGVACSDPDCSIIESDNEGDLTSEDYPEPIDFSRLEDSREYDVEDWVGDPDHGAVDDYCDPMNSPDWEE